MPTRQQPDNDRKEPLGEVKRELWVLSGNECAFPDCHQRLLCDDGAFVGEIAHIHAVKRTSARYDPSLSGDDLRAPENLMLMCGVHHTRIDSPASRHRYSVAALKKMKQQHEDRFRKAPEADVCLPLIKAARGLCEAFEKSEEVAVVLEVHRYPEMRRRYLDDGWLTGGLAEAQQWWDNTQTRVAEAHQRLLDVIDVVGVYGPKEVREQLVPLADLGKELVEISSWSHPIESDDSLVREGKVMNPYDAIRKYNAVLQSIRDAVHTTNR